jgi:hypothetical protein
MKASQAMKAYQGMNLSIYFDGHAGVPVWGFQLYTAL